MALENLDDPIEIKKSSHRGSTINLYIIAVLTLWKSICRSIKDIHNDDILRELQEDKETKLTEKSKKEKYKNGVNIKADLMDTINKIGKERKQEILEISGPINDDKTLISEIQEKYKINLGKYNANINAIEENIDNIITTLNQEMAKFTKNNKIREAKKIELLVKIDDILSNANIYIVDKNTKKKESKDLADKILAHQQSAQKTSSEIANEETKLTDLINEYNVLNHVQSRARGDQNLRKDKTDEIKKQNEVKEQRGKITTLNNKNERNEKEQKTKEEKNEKLIREIAENNKTLETLVGNRNGSLIIKEYDNQKKIVIYVDNEKFIVSGKLGPLITEYNNIINIKKVGSIEDLKGEDDEWDIYDENDENDDTIRDKKNNKINDYKELLKFANDIKTNYFSVDKKKELAVDKEEDFIFTKSFDGDLTEIFRALSDDDEKDKIEAYNKKPEWENLNQNLSESDSSDTDVFDATKMIDPTITDKIIIYNMFRVLDNTYIKTKNLNDLTSRDKKIYSNFCTILNKLEDTDVRNNLDVYATDKASQIGKFFKQIESLDNNYTIAKEGNTEIGGYMTSIIGLYNAIKNPTNEKPITKEKSILKQIFSSRYKLVRFIELKLCEPIKQITTDKREEKENKKEKETINNRRKFQIIKNINEKIDNITKNDHVLNFKYNYFQMRYIVESEDCWYLPNLDNESKTKYIKKLDQIKKDELDIADSWIKYKTTLNKNVKDKINNLKDEKFDTIIGNILDAKFEKEGKRKERENLRTILKNPEKKQIFRKAFKEKIERDSKNLDDYKFDDYIYDNYTETVDGGDIPNKYIKLLDLEKELAELQEKQKINQKSLSFLKYDDVMWGGKGGSGLSNTQKNKNNNFTVLDYKIGAKLKEIKDMYKKYFKTVPLPKHTILTTHDHTDPGEEKTADTPTNPDRTDPDGEKTADIPTNPDRTDPDGEKTADTPTNPDRTDPDGKKTTNIVDIYIDENVKKLFGKDATFDYGNKKYKLYAGKKTKIDKDIAKLKRKYFKLKTKEK